MGSSEELRPGGGQLGSARTKSAVAALAVAGLAVLSGGSVANGAEGTITLEQTVHGGDPAEGYSPLAPGGGEPYVVREELSPAQAERTKNRRSLIYFGQLSDFQLADEESPGREERFDAEPFKRLTTSGFRPQEALVPHQIELSIRQLNRFTRSPVRDGKGKRAKLANAVLTGDLADNMQFNETDWVRRLLEGGTLDPNTGTNDYSGAALCGVVNGLLPPDDPANYTGVQDYDDYLLDNPVYYDPEEPLGIWADRGWPVYPNLMDRAQRPFEAEGLDVPSYVAFGNHDGLYQGTTQAFPGLVTTGLTFEQVATGCLKLVFPLTDADAAGALLNPQTLLGVLASDPTKALQVPPDPRRRFVNHPEFKSVFEAAEQKDAHGFAYVDKGELEASNGTAAYYSFSPRPGIRFIVLDTLADAGLLVGANSDLEVTTGADGNIDDPQWQWLQGELRRAEEAGELVLAFGHHATGSLKMEIADEAAPCLGIPDEHGHDLNPSCDLDPRASTPIHRGGELADLFLRHRNVIAYVAGHSHENLVTPFQREGGGGGFWEIKSPALADWPPQHRLIEVMDNRDGTLSLFGTMLDSAAPVEAPPSGTDASEMNLQELAAVARTMTYNDPQAGPGEAEGKPEDRNVELLLPDPRPAAAAPCSTDITGNAKGERLKGGPGSDRIRGRGGDDRIAGRGGDDCLQGGRGEDRLAAGGGDDRLGGGRARDRLSGGGGDDRIRAARGRADVIACGGGEDVVHINPRQDRAARDCEKIIEHGGGR